MRSPLVCLIAAMSWISGHSALAQASSADVTAILRSSLAAQTGTVAVQDVTLAGSAERIVGGNDETVPAQFKATAAGFARSDLSLSAGTLTEIRGTASSMPSGTWSHGDGKTHPIAGQNLFTDAAWYFPLFVVQRLLSDPKASITFVGLEGNLAHFQATESISVSGPTGASEQIAHWSQIDLYVASTTLLPSRLTFNTHPDNNGLLDIPVVIDFSNYQTVSGVTMPMHVQRSVNGTLQLDIQVQSASFNAGLTPSTFRF